MTVPVVPDPFFQWISWMPVVPTALPSNSITQTTALGSRANFSNHSFSASMLGGCRSDRKRVTSRSSNQVIITATSSSRGGRRRTSLPWMTGPYMGRKVKPLARRVELRRFLDVDRNRRPLRRRQVEGAQVLSLRRRRLVANQRVHERGQVLVQLSRVERNLADGGVDNAELIGTKLDLAALDLAHGTRDVLGDGARLGVWHQTTKSAPASCASRARSPTAKTATRTFLPVPLGKTTDPRTICSACRGSTPRRMCASTVASNLEIEVSLASATACSVASPPLPLAATAASTFLAASRYFFPCLLLIASVPTLRSAADPRHRRPEPRRGWREEERIA